MRIDRLETTLASLASLIEADLAKTDTLPALNFPAVRGSNKKIGPKKGELIFPELKAEVNAPAAMNSMIEVNKALEKFMQSANKVTTMLKSKHPALATVQKLKKEMESSLQELAKHVNELGKALD